MRWIGPAMDQRRRQKERAEIRQEEWQGKMEALTADLWSLLWRG